MLNFLKKKSKIKKTNNKKQEVNRVYSPQIDELSQLSLETKKNLYLRAIELYMNDACAPIDAFFAQDDIKKAVKAFMQVALENATEQATGRQGCFMTNCVSNSVCSVVGTKELLKKAIFSADQN